MKRDKYLNKLIAKKSNGMIKVITGLRRSGKSYLLFELFYNYLKAEGVEDNHIIKIALDDRINIKYRNPDYLCQYVHDFVKDNDMYYVLLDEVQFVPDFEDVLNSFLHINNVDVYVTGSNAKFLSEDIITEFRGRGDQVHIYPLSFSEFMQERHDSPREAWEEYTMYGGLPKLLELNSNEDKTNYLKSIFAETYLIDIVERNAIRSSGEIEELLDYIAYAIGGLTNAKKLADTFKTVKGASIHPDTIKKYLDYLEDSFLIAKAKRYDIKGKKYINTPVKYYFSDVGLRNARLNFRQYEENHIMENIVYNELCLRGFNVDVGVVEHTQCLGHNKKVQSQLEIDFVCNLGSKRLYIQSAFAIPTLEKEEQEKKSLINVNDSFKKVIIVKY